ncbi:tetratricopeptide repeat protein [Candidatus Tisiphia endosymbiont of Nemotelus uliginosus]|uniref:tetratricopeptide repeat protein n=1 Tax=Candidatus Tisiphia endosymbiont of Nemotelus uliginosus TaxID=3077926 RepID=UPI0035C8A337
MSKYLLIIMVLIMLYTAVAQAKVSNLVTPVSYFVDHVKQLTSLKNNLIKYRKASIVGISGMGKTQLARMYAYENKDHYKLIWFIDCNLDINEEFLKLAKLINEKAKTNLILEDVSSVKKEVISYLSTKDKWLLVFDNLKVKENYKVKEFINWEHNGHIIFGSQDSELLPNIVKMTAFAKDDAITLANNILENSDLQFAEFLSQEFAGYPILIVQGAQLLNQVPGLDKEEYKKKIQQSTDKIKLNITLAIKELKPSARELLNKIALINNQAFSKDLLRIITDDQNLLGDDIYQLSKFALIANIDPNETNPIFEMHDVIAQKIAEINGEKVNKVCLDEVISRLVNAVPKSIVQARAFRNSKTIAENIAVISSNSEKYSISLYKLMELNLQLIVQYVNSLDLYNAEKLVNWFNQNDQQSKFKLWLMNNDEKSRYAAYLELIGAYYRNATNNHLAVQYITKAKKVFEDVRGYENYKNSTVLWLATTNILLGRIQEAEKNIQDIEQMCNKSVNDKSDIGFIFSAKAKLFFIQGKYITSLELINKAIESCIKNGLQSDDLFFINPYLFKAEVLNYLKKYQEAFAQTEQLYRMCKPSQKETQEVFGRIFTQMSRAKLGLGNAQEALEYAEKAKTIFINDPSRPNNSREIAVSPDIYLAKACVAEADALAALGQNEKAAKSYLDAENFYWNNYRENIGNVDEVSSMYLSAAKASCHLHEKAWYIKFHDQHIKKFGADHPRSIEILNMDDTCYPESQR